MIRVHSYESMGTFDGPGLRLVVFLQGCAMRCLYCANPDTIDLIGQGTLTKDQHIIDMAMSQRPFFGKKGGVTFSGGEPTLQAKELIPIVSRLKELGIHTCIDTNGSIWNDDVEQLFTLVDLVLLDVKQYNNARHLELTGRDNAQVLETAAWLEQHARPFWLRHVLVEGHSAIDSDMRALAEHFKDYKMIERVELLPYHTLGVHKYEAMNKPYKLHDVKECSEQRLIEIKAIFEQYFDNVYIN